MQDFPPITYRTLLEQRQGKGFPEAEVRAILEQVLVQLNRLHEQGRSHGSISLDAIARQGDRIILLDPTVYQTQANLAQDTYNLGAASLELLTGMAAHHLQNPNGSWNWDDYCLISDQLAAVLERAVSPVPQHRYPNAVTLQQALSGTPNLIPPTQISPPATPVSHPVLQESTAKGKLALWQWGLIGASGTIVVALAGLGLASLLAHQTSQNADPEPISSVAETPEPEESNRESGFAPNSTPKPAPDRFIQEHYSLLNQRLYETTWKNLAPEFQSQAGGFSAYIDWWNSVQQIDVGEVRVLSQNEEEAVVDARLSYLMKKGTVSQDPKSRIYLRWNESLASWQFYDKNEPD